MKVTVLVFSRLREVIGADQLAIELTDGSGIGELVETLERKHPGLAGWRGKLLLARNGEWADAETEIAEGDEIALMPPVQGG